MTSTEVPGGDAAPSDITPAPDAVSSHAVAARVRAAIVATCVEPYYARKVGEGSQTVRVVPYLRARQWRPGRPWHIFGRRAAILQASGIVWACGGLAVALLVAAPLLENRVGIINGHPEVLPGAPASTIQLVASLVAPGLLGITSMAAQALAIAGGLAFTFGVPARPGALARAVLGRASRLAAPLVVAGVAVVGAVLGIWYAVDPATQTRDWLGVSASVVGAMVVFAFLTWLVPTALCEDRGPAGVWRRGAQTLLVDRPGATLWPLVALAGVPQGALAWLAFEAGARWSRQYAGATYLALVALVAMAGALVSCWSGFITARLYLARQPYVGRAEPDAVTRVLPHLPRLLGGLAGLTRARGGAPAVVRAGVGLLAAVVPVGLLALVQALNPTGVLGVTMSFVDYPSEAESAVVTGGMTPLPVGYGDIVLAGDTTAVLDSGARGTGFFSPRGTEFGDAAVFFSCDPQATTCPAAAAAAPYALLAGARMAPAGAGLVAVSGWLTTPDTAGQTTTASMCGPYECRNPGPRQRLDRLVLLVCRPDQCTRDLADGKAVDVGPVTNTPASDGRYRQTDSAVVALGQDRFAVLGWRPRPDYQGGPDAATQATLTICGVTSCGTPQRIGGARDTFALTQRDGLPVPVTFDLDTGEVAALVCAQAQCASPARQVLVAGAAALPERQPDARDWPSQWLADAAVRDDGGLVVSYTDPVSLSPTLAWCADASCGAVDLRVLDPATVAQAPVRLAAGQRADLYYTITNPETGALQLGSCSLRGCDPADRTDLAYFDTHQVLTWRDPIYGPTSVSLQVDAAGRPAVAWAGVPASSGHGAMSGLMTCAYPRCAPR